MQGRKFIKSKNKEKQGVRARNTVRKTNDRRPFVGEPERKFKGDEKIVRGVGNFSTQTGL